MKKKYCTTVLSNEQIADGIFDMRLQFEEALPEIRPGQFVGVYTQDASMLLPRPISICGADPERRQLRLVYRRAGKGTGEMAGWKAGMKSDVLGILGNGYDMEKLRGKKVLLLGGGIGIPPLLELAARLNGDGSDGNGAAGTRVTAVLGYRNGEAFLADEFRSYGEVFIASEDGSIGTRGNVMTAIREKGLSGGCLCACGPVPMLKAVREYATETGTEAYLSLEARMACGVGACLGCVCETAEIDAHSGVRNARVCVEGPVFPAADVVL